MAPEIVKALKLSGVEPPENLLKFATDFRNKVAQGKAQKQKNKFIQGQGYTFKEEEFDGTTKTGTQVKNMFGAHYAFEDHQSDDEIL